MPVTVGPTAYFYGQFTDDSQKDVTIPKGHRSQALGLGAQAIYTIGHGAILAKYYHQTLVQNPVGGDQFWIQFAIPSNVAPLFTVGTIGGMLPCGRVTK